MEWKLGIRVFLIVLSSKIHQKNLASFQSLLYISLFIISKTLNAPGPMSPRPVRSNLQYDPVPTWVIQGTGDVVCPAWAAQKLVGMMFCKNKKSRDTL